MQVGLFRKARTSRNLHGNGLGVHSEAEQVVTTTCEQGEEMDGMKCHGDPRQTHAGRG